MKRRRVKVPKVGELVEVHWVDSGAEERGDTSAVRPAHLHVATTYGRVHSCGPDPKLKAEGVPTDTLILVMCSDESGDSSATLGAIWVPAILSIKVHDGPKN